LNTSNNNQNNKNNIDKDEYKIDNIAEVILNESSKICLVILILLFFYFVFELYIETFFVIKLKTEFNEIKFTREAVEIIIFAIFFINYYILPMRVYKKLDHLKEKKSSENKKNNHPMKKFNLIPRLAYILKIRRTSSSKEKKFKNTYYNLKFIVIVCINILFLMIIIFLLYLSSPYIPYGDMRLLQIHLLLIFQIIYTSIIMLIISSFFRKDIWSINFDKKLIKITIIMYHFIVYLSFSILFPFIILEIFRDIYLNYSNLWDIVIFTLILILIALINGSLTFYFFYKKAKKKSYLNKNAIKIKKVNVKSSYNAHLIILIILYNFVGLYVSAYFMMYPFMINIIINIVYGATLFGVICINYVIISSPLIKNKIINKTKQFIILYSIFLFLIGIGSIIFNLLMGIIFNDFGLYEIAPIYLTFSIILIGIYIVSNLSITLYNVCKIKFEINKIVLEK